MLTVAFLDYVLTRSRYSPAALSGHPQDLQRRAQALAVECRELEAQVEVTRDETVAYLKSINSNSLIDIFIQGDEIQFLTTVTMVYRAMPVPEGSPSRFSHVCLETARRTMKVHQECIRSLCYGSYMKSIYVHWYDFYVPFEDGH